MSFGDAVRGDVLHAASLHQSQRARALIGRIAYRLLLPGGLAPATAGPAGVFEGIAAKPITLGLYFVMASYYIRFAADVLKKSRYALSHALKRLGSARRL